MACLSCGISPVFKTLSRAAAKAAGEKLRRMRVLRVADDWVRRAEVCERCPLRVIHQGISYCGSPLLHQVVRDPHTDGCGCPTHAKARDPHEHCPLTLRYGVPRTTDAGCDCRWCATASTGAPKPTT